MAGILSGDEGSRLGATSTGVADESASGGQLGAQPVANEKPGPSLRDYGNVAIGWSIIGVGVWTLVGAGMGVAVDANRLIGPLVAMAGLVWLAWWVTLIVRNYAVLAGLGSPMYFRRYSGEAPPEWVERPGRTLNNLFELPPLFYLVAVLMMLTGVVDLAQLYLAWAFVGLRTIHAVVYGIWNYLPARFGSYTAGLMVLALIWCRFVYHSSDLWWS